MVERALVARIDLFAITDHNSALNAPAFAIACARACRRTSGYGPLPEVEAMSAPAHDNSRYAAEPIPLFGLELSPFEEAHLLVLFPDPLAALSFSDCVRHYLPERAVDSLRFGDQVAVDPEGVILSMPSAWYGNPLRETFKFFAEAGARAGALVIPAHVDRAQFSVYSQLGFLPEGPYDAIEAVGREPDASLRLDHCVISGSDAHILEHIGRRSSALELEDTDENLAMLDSLRKRLARLAEVWENARGGGAMADCSSREAEASICAEGVSTKIPDMAPLVEFLAAWYPRAESLALFEKLRGALRSRRAWGSHERPRAV